MGISVHYDMVATSTNIEKLAEKMRQMAMDLPFEAVSDLVILEGNDIPKDKEECWRHPSGYGSHMVCEVPMPWTKMRHYYGESKRSYSQQSKSCHVFAEKMVAFTVDVGDGCEPMKICFVKLPKTAKADYKIEEDIRFNSYTTSTMIGETGGFGRWHFDYSKWRKHCKKKNQDTFPYDKYNDVRELKVPNGGKWYAYGWSKTEYSGLPECGGMPNFLKCHVAVVKYLEKLNSMRGLKVTIDDEGRFGTARYSDDYREAYAADREPTYVWHPATHSIDTLAKECEESKQGLALMFGSLKNLGHDVIAPITNYANFEQLEFQGTLNEDYQPFLKAMSAVADKIRAENTAA